MSQVALSSQYSVGCRHGFQLQEATYLVLVPLFINLHLPQPVLTNPILQPSLLFEFAQTAHLGICPPPRASVLSRVRGVLVTSCLFYLQGSFFPIATSQLPPILFPCDITGPHSSTQHLSHLRSANVLLAALVFFAVGGAPRQSSGRCVVIFTTTHLIPVVLNPLDCKPTSRQPTI